MPAPSFRSAGCNWGHEQAPRSLGTGAQHLYQISLDQYRRGSFAAAREGLEELLSCTPLRSRAGAQFYIARPTGGAECGDGRFGVRVGGVSFPRATRRRPRSISSDVTRPSGKKSTRVKCGRVVGTIRARTSDPRADWLRGVRQQEGVMALGTQRNAFLELSRNSGCA